MDVGSGDGAAEAVAATTPLGIPEEECDRGATAVDGAQSLSSETATDDDRDSPGLQVAAPRPLRQRVVHLNDMDSRASDE